MRPPIIYTEIQLREAIASSKTYRETAIKLGFDQTNLRSNTCDQIERDSLRFGINTDNLLPRKRHKRDFDSAILRDMAKQSASMTDLIEKLNVTTSSRASIAVQLEEHGIDISHFYRRRHLQNATHSATKNLNDILSNKIPCKTTWLKSILFKTGLKNRFCEKCKRREYLGEEIPLELNHKDGDKLNNQLENLEVLCANCHSLTTSFAGRNKKCAILWRMPVELLHQTVKQSTSPYDFLMRVYGMRDLAKTKYRSVRKVIALRGCDTSHWRIAKTSQSKKLDIDQFLKTLVLDSTIKTTRLRDNLIRYGIKKARCEMCEICDWDGQVLSFSLDHINGCRTDNRLENLRIVCFICHARTPTYKGKNRRLKERSPRFELGLSPWQGDGRPTTP